MGRYLVTGASGGMGRAICAELIKKGHKVFGIDARAPEEGAEWSFLKADVTDESQLAEAFDKISAEAVSLDGIINAAGIYDLGSLVEISGERLAHDFDVNLFGMTRVNRLFLPILREGGRIVIISSELAPLDPLPFTGIYAITKAAVEKYAFSLRMELQLIGRKVIVVRPGAVDTGLLPASMRCIERFNGSTRLYRVNAGRFTSIVGRIETRTVSPEALAKKVMKALTARRPRLVYKINRNPLLLILNALPDRMQLFIIKKILK